MPAASRPVRNLLLDTVLAAYRAIPLGRGARLRFSQWLNARAPHFVHALRLRRAGIDGENAIANPFGALDVEAPLALDEIVFTSSDAPLVSIIIPVYGKLALTLACLSSIVRHPPKVAYEVLVLDDASPDDSATTLAGIRGLRLLRNDTNLGFLLTCNRGAHEARGRYLVFLNNDTRVLPGWCDELIAPLESDETIGLAGAKLLYPNGRLQEAGGIVWNDASAWNYGRLDDPAKPEYNYVKDVDYCSGAAIAVPRALFERLNGFDTLFAPAYCEDTDLAFRVRQLGKRVVFTPFSRVIHVEGASSGTDTSSGVKAYQPINQRKFYERWRATLERTHERNACDVFRARDRSFGKPTILFIDHYVPQFDRDAGSRTLDQYMQLLLGEGFNVKLWPHNLYYDPVYTPRYQRMGIETFYSAHGVAFDTWIKNHGQSLDYVFLSRPEVAVEYLSRLRLHARAKLLFYGHDLHQLRFRREQVLHHDAQLDKLATKFERIERDVWNGVDVIYYPSAIECEIVRAAAPGKVVREFPILLYGDPPATNNAFGERAQLLFVGGFAHSPNLDAVLWFANEILPLVRNALGNVCLNVVGSNPPPEVKALEGDAIHVLGHVSDAELASLYARCRLTVAPLRAGAGVKGKIIESLYHGCPVVTTSTGAEGVQGAEGFLAIADDAQAFADKLVELYRSEPLWSRLRDGGRRFVRDHFSVTAARKLLALDMPDLIDNTQQKRA